MTRNDDYDLRPLHIILAEPELSPRDRWQAEHDAFDAERIRLERRQTATRNKGA